MLTRTRICREYRRQGLRRAWALAGMWPVAWGTVKCALLGMAENLPHIVEITTPNEAVEPPRVRALLAH